MFLFSKISSLISLARASSSRSSLSVALASTAPPDAICMRRLVYCILLIN